MPFSVPHRKTAALVAAASGLAAVLSGVAAPAASATPTDTNSWFADPRTPEERSVAVAVPKNPKAYAGERAETRALYRTRAGELAVPVDAAFGQVLVQGQAVTIDRPRLFDRSSLNQLATALRDASSIRCEGYADYAGKPSRKQVSAQRRAARVCRSLVASSPGLKATSVGYGMGRPAVVADRGRDRRTNRRVVVQMTGTRVVADRPSAPVEVSVSGAHGALTTIFGAPLSDGGSPVTGYSISYDGGVSWSPATVSGDAPWTVVAHGFVNGTTYDVRVRAENSAGTGPAAGSEALVATLAGAPTLEAALEGSDVRLTISAPAFDGGVPITRYQLSLDGGENWDGLSLAENPAEPGVYRTSVRLGYGMTFDIRVRGVNDRGAGTTSNAAVVKVPEAPPAAYRPEYYYSGGRVWTYVFFTTVPGALRYEARLDDGEWLPVTVEAGWITEAMGGVDDPVCGGSTCTGERTVSVRAVTAEGPGEAGRPFPVTHLVI